MTPGRAWLGFTAMCVGMFMAILDIQIVAAALPTIEHALHIPLDQLSWIQTAYLITEVIAIALSGRLTRALSTRGVFTLGVAGFVVASIGCALSRSFVPLIVWRTIQGFCGGVIIPTVFATGFTMFARALQARALLVAGALAMLAPSVGPLLGGFIAEKLSWHWLFLINVPTGIVVALLAYALIRVDEADPRAWRTIDPIALIALAAGLAMLETLLKVTPGDRWTQFRDLSLEIGIFVTGFVFIRRCIGRADPLVDFAPLRAKSFTAACVLNFALGLGLYGSVYVLPLFLGVVRGHSALQIGLIMTVTGVAQLLAAPIATFADKRFPPVWVAAFGFALFGAGSLANAFATPASDFSELLLPQILRGAAVLFCILPITTVALEGQPATQLGNASGLLNLMRNIGGAVGIGLVDTLINVRPASIAAHLAAELAAGSRRTAEYVGLPPALFTGRAMTHVDPSSAAFARPLVERAAATIAFNEAWILLGALMLLSLVSVPLLRRPQRASGWTKAVGAHAASDPIT
ncbi:MAG: DHA2 family efflux MFS transporter permease subunit [Candidatus Elarobacter sp.]